MRSILLVDDKPRLLERLTADVREVLSKDEAAIRAWCPEGAEDDPLYAFEKHVTSDTTLVVTDHDLTSRGQVGLFGSTIVHWCQQKAIPVGDFSRGSPVQLPTEPDLFELRIPTDGTAGQYIASLFRGFRDISDAIAADETLLQERSPAAVLARILGVPSAENRFALYTVRLGAASGALAGLVAATAPEDARPSIRERRTLLSYVVAHLLLTVLRFPGPIISEDALCAYVGTDLTESEVMRTVFGAALYSGPFSGLHVYFRLSLVDELLDQLKAQDFEAETSGALHRAALEAKLSRNLARHACRRCGGVNGGFYCPFTRRTVCERQDCSVGANSWIPQGATLCRIERDFYDEWGPLFGM
jgi:hypothetical protein